MKQVAVGTLGANLYFVTIQNGYSDSMKGRPQLEEDMDAQAKARKTVSFLDQLRADATTQAQNVPVKAYNPNSPQVTQPPESLSATLE